MTTPACRSVGAAMVDELVAVRLLQALGPEEVALALAAADEVAERRERTTRASELALERARYEADRAERAFLACEPENRLVARSLEGRWEAKLAVLSEAEAALAACRARVAPLPSRIELEALAADLPALWAAPTTSAKDRKRLLRTLIADVTLTSQKQDDELRIGILWRSGASEEIVTQRPLPVYQGRRTPAAAAELIVRLGPALSDEALVAELGAAGFTTGMGRPFDVQAVRWVRHLYHVPSPSPFGAGELSVAEVAARLGISANAVYYWIAQGLLAARYSQRGRWCVPFSPEVEAACRKRVADSYHIRPATQIARVGVAV